MGCKVYCVLYLLECVAGEGRDGECLHECGEVSEGEDAGPEKHCTRGGRQVAALDLAQHEIREGVVRDEVEVRREEHTDGHVV